MAKWTPDYKSGMWVWYDEGRWLSAAVDAGLGYVLLKAGDGNRPWSQFHRGIVDQCHEAGIACVAWMYNYLDDPAGEARVGINALNAGADGLVLDIEYEAIGKLSQAEHLIGELRSSQPDAWIGHAPDLRIAFANQWPRRGFSPDVQPWPWEATSHLDGVMPQLYWVDFAQTPRDTLQLANLWREGCEGRGWRVPPIYPVFPSTAYPNDIFNAGTLANEWNFPGANLWRWANGHAGNPAALGSVVWTTPENTAPIEEEDMATIDWLRTYIGEMGAEDGSIVQALDTELAKPKPDKNQIRNIRNRLVELRNEALGG